MIHTIINALRGHSFYIAGLCCSLLLLASCDDFLEVPAPDSQLNTAAVFQDYSSASAALTDIYAAMRDQGLLFGNISGMGAQLGCYADELQAYGGPSSVNQPFFTDNLLPSNGTVASWWTAAYRQVYAANAVLEGVSESQALTASQKGQLTGEALFIRSLLHFNLLAVYGDIPYITTTDYRLNSTVSRTPVSLVYQLLEEDLLAAKGLLPSSYPDSERTRPNASVAAALLSKVYLYGGKYAEAAEQASLVIADAAYNLPGDVTQTFLKGSPSTIWQLLPRSQGRNTNEGAAFILLTAPPATVALTDELMASFEAGDLRREHWVGSVTNGTETFYFPFKYKEYQSAGESLEYSIIFRLSEQYLIRAEARAQTGNLEGAKEDIDYIRANAGLPPTTQAGLQGLLDAVLAERRSELFTEFGHRFFDLRRLGLLDTTLGAVKPGWQSTDRLLPLPENELLLNASLTQNPGY